MIRRYAAAWFGPARRGLVTGGVLGVLLVAPLLLAGSGGAVATGVAVALVAAGVVTRRRMPLLSLLLATGVSLLYLIVGFGTLSPWAAVAMAVLSFLAGRRSASYRAALAGFVAVAAAGLPLAFVAGDGWTWLLMLVVELAAVLPWFLGHVLRLRAEVAEAGWARAQQLAREQRIVAEQARLRERTRIARDMHDTLGHRLSLIALQAGALELQAGPGEAARAVRQLRVSAVSATDLLHEIVGLLGEVSEPSADQPLDESVDALVDRVRGAGAPVTLHRDGQPAGVSELVDRTVYRVVQESLTNAVKHAPGSPVSVRLTYHPGQTEVEVSNPLSPAAPEAAPPGGGRGLTGLQERVRLAGGTLHTGADAGRFSVLARLPGARAYQERPPPERVPGRPAPVDDRPAPVDELRQAKRHMRRDLRWAAALPVVLLVGLAVTFLGLRTYTTTSTALNPAAFDRMQVGQTHAELDRWLPPARMTETLPVVPEPAVPTGAACEYYRTTGNPFSLSNDLYRLCFRDDLLVSKHRLVEG